MRVQNDAELVKLLDDLYHQLKCSPGTLCGDFRWHLRAFLGRWGLDKDEDAYASFPKHPVWPRVIAFRCRKCDRFGQMMLYSMEDESALYICECNGVTRVAGAGEAFE